MTLWAFTSASRKNAKPPKARLALIVVAVGVLEAATISPASAGTTPIPADPRQSATADLGITATADGWIHYRHTLAGQVKAGTVTLLKGVRSDGTCVFRTPEVAAVRGSSGYSEETDFNPVTCQATVVSGDLSAAGQAKLTESDSGDTHSRASTPSNAESTSAPAAPRKASTGGTAARPSSTGSWMAFEKVSYVDPFDITITSLVDNLAWSGNGVPASANGKITGGSANAVSYKFNWDNWSTSSISFAWRGCVGCTYLTNQAAQTFYNRDFERVVVALTGIAGYAACGFDSGKATFYLSPWTQGYPNAYYSWGHANSVKGGCSDLVHFRENHGAGHSS